MRHIAPIVIIAVLAFSCGALFIAWRVEHGRADCWREQAEEGVAPEGKCDP